MTEPPPLGKWFFKLFISSNVFCLLLDATVVFDWKKYSLLLFGAYELFCCSRWSGMGAAMKEPCCFWNLLLCPWLLPPS